MAAPANPRLDARNDRVLLACVALVFAMLGLSFAAAPLYEVLCRITGMDGTVRIASAAPDRVADRIITVRFDSNVAGGLPWAFAPERRAMDVKVGENNLMFYAAANEGDHPISGTATFNVTPEKAGAYFAKLQCFCFSEQRLEPGQRVEMPVSFFVDPAIMDDPNMADVSVITLSYTFFEHPNPAVQAADTKPERLAALDAD